MKPANNSNQNSWKKSRHINLKNNIKTKYIITFIIYAMIFLYIYFFTMFMWILNKYLYYLLTVLDENDETPLFDPQTVTVNLLENVTVNSLIHTFTATDRDASSTPRNSEIEYVLILYCLLYILVWFKSFVMLIIHLQHCCAKLDFHFTCISIYTLHIHIF